MKDGEQTDMMVLAEERLRLEREALDIERGRLAAAREAWDAERNLAHGMRPGVRLALAAVSLTAAFVLGALAGGLWTEARSDARRERRLALALSKIGDLSNGSTNGVSDARQRAPILVIQ